MDAMTKSPKKKKLADTVSARRLDRCFKVFELRKGGASFRAIGEALKKQDIENGGNGRGYSHTQAKTDFAFAVAVKTEELGDIVEEARILTAERIDEIYLRIYPLLKSSKPDEQLAAANTLIRANREYAELHGAKRPQKLEVTGQDGKPVEVVTAITIQAVASHIEKPEMPPDEDDV